MENYRYKAFISYKHTDADKKIAVKLQKMLESYKPPKSISKKEKWHIFRDESEFAASPNLSEEIKDALKSSEFLIAICSSLTKESRWCAEEISYFKSIHGNTTDNIITLVTEGNVNDVIPVQLLRSANRTEEDREVKEEINVEPMAVNIAAASLKASMKKLRKEFLRIAAPLLYCGYDDLYNREQKRKRRRLTAAVIVIAVIIMLFGIMMLRINSQNAELRISKAADLAVKAENMFSEGDRIGAIKTAISVRPYADDPYRLLPATYRFLTGATYAYNGLTENSLNSNSNGILKTKSDVTEFIKCPNSSEIMAIDEGKRLYIWNIENLRRIYYDEDIENAVFVGKNKIIAEKQDKLYMMEYKTNKIIWEIKRESDNNNFLAISPDNKILIYQDNWVDTIFVDADTGKEIYIFHTDNIMGEATKKFCEFINSECFIYASTLSDEVYILNFADKSSYKIRDFNIDRNLGGFTAYDNKVIIAEEDEEKKLILSIYDCTGNLLQTTKLEYDNKFANFFGSNLNKIFAIETNGESYICMNNFGKTLFAEMTTGKTFSVDNTHDILSGMIVNNSMAIINNKGEYIIYTDLPKEWSSLRYFEFGNISDALMVTTSDFALLSEDKRTIYVATNQSDKNYIRKFNTDEIILFDYNGKYMAVWDDDRNASIYTTDTFSPLSKIQTNGYYYNAKLYNNILMVGNHFKYDFYDIASGELIYSFDEGNTEVKYNKYKIKPQLNTIVYMGKGSSGMPEIYVRSNGKIIGHYILKTAEEQDAIPFSQIEDININDSGDRIALLVYNEGKQKNILYEYDTINRRLIKRIELQGIGEYEYNSNYLNYNENGTLSAYICNKLYLFDRQGNIIDNISLNFPVDYIKNVPKSEDLLLFGTNGDIHKYSAKAHGITGEYQLEDRIITDTYAVYNVQGRNQIALVTEGNYINDILFLDADTLELWAEVDGMYCNSSTPIVTRSGGSIYFYPYYTDKQLVERAEDICNTYGME